MNRQTGARAQRVGLARPDGGRSWERAALGPLFLALLALCGLFPLTGDDWFREELGRHLTGPLDLLEAVLAGWRTYNGGFWAISWPTPPGAAGCSGSCSGPPSSSGRCAWPPGTGASAPCGGRC